MNSVFRFATCRTLSYCFGEFSSMLCLQCAGAIQRAFLLREPINALGMGGRPILLIVCHNGESDDTTVLLVSALGRRQRIGTDIVSLTFDIVGRIWHGCVETDRQMVAERFFKGLFGIAFVREGRFEG
jgi:hypothetical protein